MVLVGAMAVMQRRARLRASSLCSWCCVHSLRRGGKCCCLSTKLWHQQLSKKAARAKRTSVRSAQSQ